MNKKGFSLIELLAVIVIIGIIALITFPIVDDIISNSEKKAFKASVDELVNLTEMDYNEFGRTGVVVYTLNNKKLTCNLCTNNIKYNGEIEDGTGTITLENGVEMINPGDKDVTINVELKEAIEIKEGMDFVIKEGGRTIGKGKVTAIENT